MSTETMNAAVAGTSEEINNSEGSAASAVGGRFATFLKSSLPDALICLILSVALVLTVSFAFESAPDLRGNVAVVGALVLPMIAFLFVGAWSKKFVALSAVLCVVYAVCVVGAFSAVTLQSVPLFESWSVNDVPENLSVFGVICMVVPALVYLLSRRRLGVVVLAFASVLTCAFVQFMYRDWQDSAGTLVFFVVLFSTVAMFIFQYYRESLAKVSHMGRATFTRALAYSSLISVVCIAIGVLLYITLIAPLNLTTPEVKPFEDYYSRPTVEYSGVYQRQSVENPDMTSNQTTDEVDDTQEDAEGGQEETDVTDEAPGGAIGAIINQVSSFDLQEWNQQFMTINYGQVALSFVWLVFLVILLLIAVYILQKNRWKIRLNKFEAMPLSERVVATYNYICKGLGKLGCKKPANATPMEFALSSRAQLEPFNRNTGGVDFLALTLIWQRASYDVGRLTEEDWAHMRTYYENFLPNSKNYLGKYKWLIYFWRL